MRWPSDRVASVSGGRRRALRIALTVVVVAVVGYFFGRSLLDNIDAVRDIDFTLDGWIVASVLLFAWAVVVSGQLWGRMTSELSGHRVPALEAIRVHSLSWLLKYVPGQVGSVVNKVAWAKDVGISRTLVTLTFVYENVFLLVGSLVPPTVVLLAMGTFDVSGNGMLVLALVSLVPLLALTNRRFFRWASNLLARRTLKREIPHEYFLTSRQSLRFQVLYLLPRVVNGVGVVAIAISMIDPPASTYLPLACAYIIAGAVGILAVFVPSGIGVRESVFVLLATPYVPVEQAIVLSLAARLLATLADAVVAALYLALRALSHRKGHTA
ncbi:lysylphosphatidylglycerol synthase domain-containing protein [Cellulosimicrobium sp. Marseille-Q4280]|uniref:lysylphosphatidylglycerol synthase domain-containing protein n=1 Tax=Cellulosimicrobium sp. Marseille-Q4280 TaxID=2937992 RepID=UPI00203F3679|nr:lysylphosphatidylglycerol synthase domain-containing protein [Cellulosimicrobium sp. Marseille-Q4280]